MRYPDSSDAFELALNGVAANLRPGAPLWVYGDIREGALSATRVLRGLFDLRQPIEERDDTRIFVAARNSSEAKGPMEAWARTSTIDLGSGPQEWVSFPGLFAAGLVDVMTTFLLEQLAGAIEAGDAPWCLKRRCRCLDFGCGTGVLAAGLLRHLPRARVSLLDADSVALEAAGRNLSNAEAVVLSDGLSGLADAFDGMEGRAAAPIFHLIVSNPPVHQGHPDDLRVLQRLLLEAPAWLKPKGELWVVAQEHIPVGRLSALAALELPLASPFLRVSDALPTEDGRFVVWRSVLIPGSKISPDSSDAAANGQQPAAGSDAAPATEAAEADADAPPAAARKRPLPPGAGAGGSAGGEAEAQAAVKRRKGAQA